MNALANFDVEVPTLQKKQEVSLPVTDYGNGAKGIKVDENKSIYVSPKPITIQKTAPITATWAMADSLPSINDVTTTYIQTNKVYTYRTHFAQGTATSASTAWNLTTVRDNMARSISTDYGISYDGLQTAITTDSISVGTWGTSAGTTAEYKIYFSTDNTDATTFTISGYGGIDFKEEIKNLLRSNLLIKSGRNRSHLPTQVSAQELKARDTLRDMVTEADWRRYVANGFIMVKGRAGFTSPKIGGDIAQTMSRNALWYQIFNDRRRVKVFQDGKEFAEICIHTVNECPPSDHVINMKVLVELDEDMIWQGGNPSFKGGLSAALVGGTLGFNHDESANLAEKVKRLKQSLGVAVA